MGKKKNEAVRAPSVPIGTGPRFGEVLREKEKFSLRGVVYRVVRARLNGKLTIKALGLDLPKGRGKEKPNEPT